MPILETILPYLISAGLSAGGQYLGNKLSGSSSPQSPQMNPTAARQSRGGLFSENPARTERLGRFEPNQLEALNSLLSQGLGGLGNLPQASFAPIRQQAQEQFQQQTVPSIAERFTGLGAQQSSAFGEALGQAGVGLQSQLAAMEQGFNQQQRGQQFSELANLLSMGLTPQFENIYRPERPGFGQSLGLGLTKGIGASLPALIQLFNLWYGKGSNTNLNQQTTTQPNTGQG